MNTRRSFIALLFFALAAFAYGTPEANAEKFGMITLLPPLVAITLAFITKNVVLSLFIGIFTGTFLINISGGIFSAINKGFFDITAKIIGSMADSWNAGIILQVLAIGGLVALVTRMGGARAIADALSKRAKGPVSTQIITWVMGMLIFFDDYANALIVGPVMKPITDKMKISRERLAFIVDATAAPIAGIALISTWVGYEVSLIKKGFEEIGYSGMSAYTAFVETLPFRFYNLLMLAFVFFTSYMLREFGPMYKAEKRARETGKVLSDTATPMSSTEEEGILPPKDIKLSIWNAIVPIGVLIISSFVGFYINGLSSISDKLMLEKIANSPYSFYSIRETFGAADASVVLFQAALLASIVAIVMGVAKKIFKITEAIDTWVKGIKSLAITGVILLLAWSLAGVIKDLGTAKYLTLMLQDSVPKFLLPTLIFILGSVISFSTGTSYGTMGILMPLSIPLAKGVGVAAGLSGDELVAYIIVAISAVLTGAIMGDHCSPISDTTILSSMGSSCDHIEHTRTQLYYAVVIGVISIIFGYIPVGMGMNIWLVLPISMLSVFLLVRFVGKPLKQYNK